MALGLQGSLRDMVQGLGPRALRQGSLKPKKFPCDVGFTGWVGRYSIPEWRARLMKAGPKP